MLLLRKLVALLLAVPSRSLLCGRAGGAADDAAADDLAALIDWETREMCELRGCVWRANTNECHFAGASVPIKVVHLIQSNHLDVGYTDTAVGVINEYFETFFPRAIAIGAAMRARAGKPERLKWMTQSYLVTLFLDCPPHIVGLSCPNATAIEAFKGAVAAGDIVWQAFPHNAELMMLDPSLMEFAVGMTHDIDDVLNVSHKTVVSSRDVPGFDRSIIPILRKQGVTGLSMGMNGRIFPVNVPPAFVWKDNGTWSDSGVPSALSNVSFTAADYGVSGSTSSSKTTKKSTRTTKLGPPSGEEIIALWHPRGYGSLGDFVTVPGLDQALAYDWRGDNQGPPTSVVEVLAGYAAVQAKFPGATVIASTLDAYIEALYTVKDQLPVISREVGDSWIWGCAQDPTKLQQMRALMRARVASAASAATEDEEARDAAAYNFSRQLLKGSEHTWGIHVGTYGKFLNGPYTNAEFHAQRSESATNKTLQYIVDFETAWIGQRKLTVEYPLEAVLPPHPLGVRAAAEFAKFDAAASVAPDPIAEGFKPATGAIDAPRSKLAGWCDITLSATDGSIVHLATTTSSSKAWANATHPLALLRYQSLVADDMTAWRKEYLIQDCPSEYGKPGCMSATPTPTRHLDPPTPLALWEKSDPVSGDVTLLLKSSFSALLHESYGAPSTVWTRFEIPSQSADVTTGVEITFTFVNKTTTRLPEAMFVTMNPVSLVAAPPAPTPPPPPPPTPPSSAPQRGTVSVAAAAPGETQVTLTVTFATPFPAGKTPVVVVTPLQGSGGGGVNNNATFLAALRLVTPTNFEVTMQIVGDTHPSWTQEATLAYVAALPGQLPSVSYGAGAFAAAGEIGSQMDKAKVMKSIQLKFPTTGCSVAAAAAQSETNVVLTPRTTRGASSVDMFALAVSNVSCSGATVTATRAVDPKSSDVFWGEDLQFDYFVFVGATTQLGTSRVQVQRGDAAVSITAAVATVDVKFTTPFSTAPSLLASAEINVSTADGRSVAVSIVSVDASGFTAVLEILAARKPGRSAAAAAVYREGETRIARRRLGSTSSNSVAATTAAMLQWVASTDGTSPTAPPTAPPTPGPAIEGSLWGMDKLGELVDPLNLVDGGSKGLHGVSSGVLFARQTADKSTAWERVMFTTVDAGIVAWGKPDPFPTPIHAQPDMSEGASFLLWDNVWNTNYINWWPYETPGVNFGNSTYRFAIKLIDAKPY